MKSKSALLDPIWTTEAWPASTCYTNKASVTVPSGRCNKPRLYLTSMSMMPKVTRRSSLPATSSATRGRAYNRPSTAWTTDDDDTLVQARASGTSWKEIAKQHFLGKKSDNACRKRHERLVDKRKSTDWDDLKLERLALEYTNMREQLWSPLASRMSESWTVVEAKVRTAFIANKTFLT